MGIKMHSVLKISAMALVIASLSYKVSASNEFRHDLGFSIKTVTKKLTKEEVEEDLLVKVITNHGLFANSKDLKEVLGAPAGYLQNSTSEKWAGLDLRYIYPESVSLEGFIFSYDRNFSGSTSKYKNPTYVDVYVLNEDLQYDHFEKIEGLYRTSTAVTYKFSNKTPKSTTFKFVFKGSKDNLGYTGLTHFIPIWLR